MSSSSPAHDASACLDELDVMRVAAGGASIPPHVEEHLDTCSVCRRLVAEAVRQTAPDQRAETDAREPGDRLGRYVLLGRLGAGGSGVVFRAHDPELDRDVALKIVLPSADRDRDRRVVDEARAMARLTDAHVVPVYDAGTSGSAIYIVMQYMRGGTLALWLTTPRSWKEILARFIEAGRGLQAAHEIDVVHGDFKPANVLLDERGRSLVADFGLAARMSSGAALEGGAGDGDATPVRGGTPLFIAPEAVSTRSADARADQYAFCVALYSALWGRPPFSAAELESLQHAKSTEAFEAPSGRALVLWPIVRRGLRARPEQRHPSMAALLAALERERDRPRRRAWALAWFATAALGVTAGVLAMRDDAHDCPDPRHELAGVWDDNVRSRLGVHAASFESPAIASAVASASEHLDARAQAWIDAADARCRFGGPEDDAHATCLARRKQALEGLVEELLVGDREALGRSVDAAWSMPEVRECERDPANTPSDSAERRAWIAELDRIAIAADLGRIEQARARTDALLREVTGAGDAWIEAEVHLQACRDSFTAARWSDTKVSCEAASTAGIRSGNDRARTRAWLTLIELGAFDVSLQQASEVYDRLAEAAVAQFGDPELEAELHAHRGSAYGISARYPEAQAALERAVAIETELHGADHPDTARRQLKLAQTLPYLERFDEALALTTAVRDRLTASPAGSPFVIAMTYQVEGMILKQRASVTTALGTAAHRSGMQASAAAYDAAVARYTDLLGPHSPRTLYTRAVRLASTSAIEDDGGAALRELDEIVVKLRGSGEIDARGLLNLELKRNEIQVHTGRMQEAADDCPQLLERIAEIYGEDSIVLGDYLNNCGIAVQDVGHYEEALALHQRAYAVRLAARGPEFAGTIHSVAEIAALRVGLRKVDAELVSTLERALATARRIGLPEGDVAALERRIDEAAAAL
jgi:tetratricopeptide (TPR) repeat protein